MFLQRGWRLTRNSSWVQTPDHTLNAMNGSVIGHRDTETQVASAFSVCRRGGDGLIVAYQCCLAKDNGTLSTERQPQTQSLAGRPLRSRTVAALTGILAFCAVAVGGALGPAAPAAAEEPEARSFRDSCISINQIRRTEIVDDQTILFHMRGGRIQKATLAFRCPSLRFYGTIRYEVYTNRLCARVDTIISRSGSHCPIAEIEDYVAPDDDEAPDANAPR